MTIWQTANPSTGLTADDAVSPYESTPAEAQASVNFVVFEPGWLPGDCQMAAVTLRPELPPGRPDGVTAEDLGQTPWSEGNPCSVRAVVDGDGRLVRLKQFLYDWAPPAASIAPLWQTPEPTPFECGRSIGWLGTDYEDRRGGCVQRERTQLELSVLEGAFADSDLKELLDGLTPANPGSARAVRRVPFHRLNYWVRYRCRPPSVPHGLWEHNSARPYHESYPLSPVALRGDGPAQPLVPPGEKYDLDSAVVFPERDAMECVYRHVENSSDHLWLTAAAEGSPLAPSMPPDPSDQAAEIRRAVDLRGTTVHYAALTEDFGAWEAFWTEAGVRYVVWAGASRQLDGDDFLAILGELDSP